MAHKEIGEKGRADSNRVDLYKSNISGKKQTNADDALRFIDSNQRQTYITIQTQQLKGK